ncbi:MAG: beta-lactamase family protein [Nocardiaceae bacterium]|nr:beta-lactamase family protein [Nocardiaceae bacterium]
MVRRFAFLHDTLHAPDLLRRCRIPKDLASVTTRAAEVDPVDVGLSQDNVERVWRSVESLYGSGIHPALALCVRREGAVVLDRAIGHARGNGPDDHPDAEKVLATPSTPFCIFSATKGTTAALIHKLDEKGLLHIGDPVAEYLPEFARSGKAGITIGHVLSHRAGIPAAPPGTINLDMFDDIEFLREAIYNARPVFRPGKRQAYHAVSGGMVLGEVVREVTGKSIRDVLAEEFLDPLGFRWMNYGVAEADIPRVGLNYVTGPVLLPPMRQIATRALGVHPDIVTRMSNDPRFVRAVLPAANGISTANELGRFYEMLRLGGELDGVRVMEERTIRRALIPQSHMEMDLSLIAPVGFSYGFMLGGKYLSLYGMNTAQAFGHLGWINIVGWADPQRALSAALITTGKAVVYPEVLRFWMIAQQIAKEFRPV